MSETAAAGSPGATAPRARRRALGLMAAAGVVAMATCACSLFGEAADAPPADPEDQVYRGRTLREWFDEYLTTESFSESEGIASRLEGFGPAVALVPRFLRALSDPQLHERRRISALSFVCARGLATDHEPEVIRAVLDVLREGQGPLVNVTCEAIMNIGPKFVEAGPLLIANVERESVDGRLQAHWHQSYHRAAMEDVCDTPAALPFLLEAYASEKEAVRAMAVEGMSHPGAIPHAIAALEDPSEDVREVALRRLTLYEGHGAEVFPTLLGLAKGGGPLAEGAVSALAGYGDEAAPVLVRECLDPAVPLEQRLRLAQAFGRVNGFVSELRETRRGLGRLLGEGQVELRRAVASHLYAASQGARTADASAEAAELLLPHLGDEDLEVRREVADTLSRIARDRPETRRSLATRLVPEVAAWLDREHTDEAERVALALANTGGAEHLDEYLTWLAGPPAERQRAAAVVRAWAALGELDPGREQWSGPVLAAQERWLPGLADADPIVARRLIQAAGWAGPALRAAAPLVRAQEARFPEECAWALTRLEGAR